MILEDVIKFVQSIFAPEFEAKVWYAGGSGTGLNMDSFSRIHVLVLDPKTGKEFRFFVEVDPYFLRKGILIGEDLQRLESGARRFKDEINNNTHNNGRTKQQR